MKKEQMELVVLDRAGLLYINWESLLVTPLEDMSDQALVQALGMTDLALKALGKRAEALKQVLRPLVITVGEPVTERSAKMVDPFAGVEIQVTQKEAPVTVNDVALQMLLKRKGLPLETVYDMQPVRNEARLEQLIASGELSDAEIARFTSEGKTPTPAVSVKRHPFGLKPERLLE